MSDAIRGSSKWVCLPWPGVAGLNLVTYLSAGSTPAGGISRNWVRIFMNADGRTSGDRDTSPETLAAELTVAAYPIALRHGRGGLWIDWELEIWVVLVETVKKWARAFSQPEWLSTFDAWQETFLEEF